MAAAQGRPITWPGWLVVARLLFFLQCCTACAVCNFLVLYLDYRGLSYRQIGLVSGAFGPAMRLVGQPLTCIVGDLTGWYKPVILVSMVLSAGTMWGVQYVGGFLPISGMLAASWLVGGGVDPSLDAMVIHTLRSQGIGLDHYGRFRVWGAIGWGVSALGIGFVLDRFGMRSLFLAYAAGSVCYIATMACYPIMQGPTTASSAPAQLEAGGPGRASPEASERAPLLASDAPSVNTAAATTSPRAPRTTQEFLAALFGRPGVPTFFVLLVAMGTMKAVIDVFLFLFLQNDLGASGLLMGLSLVVTTVGEAPFFFYSGPILKRFGSIPVVLLSLLAYGVRTAYYSFLFNPWLLLPAELLHGLTFALAWAAIALHATKIAPPGYASSTQGIVSAAFSGIGFGLGGVGGGYLNHYYGARNLFRLAALLSGLAAALGCLAFLCLRRAMAAADATFSAEVGDAT